MCWIDPQPLTPANILQFLTVPVSLFVTWKIFEAGKKYEHVRQNLIYLISVSKEIEDELESLCRDGIEYYSKPPKKDERRSIEVGLSTRVQSLQRKLPRFAARANKENKFFLEEFIEFKEKLTGSEVGFGASALKPRQRDDALFGALQNAKDQIILKLEEVRDDCLKKSNK